MSLPTVLPPVLPLRDQIAIRAAVIEAIKQKRFVLMELHSQSGIGYSTIEAIRNGRITSPQWGTVRQLYDAMGELRAIGREINPQPA